MIHISKRAAEKLKEAYPDSQKNSFRVFVSGMGWGGPRMGLALDEPKTNDEIIKTEGFSIIVASEVADIIRSYGKLFIDYKDRLWAKGFQLSFPGKSSC